MSRIGDIYSSYGHEFNIAVANTSSQNVMAATTLPPSTIIIAGETTPYSYEDAGVFSIIVTDVDGTPSRLTYCMKAGNGLHAENGSMKMSIDNDTIVGDINGALGVNLQALSYNSSLVEKDGRLSINIDALPTASTSKAGVMKVDGFTIKSDNGTLSIDTSSLDLSSGSTAGICIGDGTTIIATAGMLNANEEAFEKCSNTSFGVAKVDGESIVASNGVASLNTAYLVSGAHAGLVRPDGITVVSSNGVLSVNKAGLRQATTGAHGTIKAGEEFGINGNGQLYLKEPANVTSYLDGFYSRISAINGDLDKIEDKLYSL